MNPCPLQWRASQMVLVVKNPPANAGDLGSIPGSRRSSGGGHSNPLQYSCLENPMDRGAWWATVHGVTKSQTQLKQISMQHVLSFTQESMGLPWWLISKESACQCRRLGFDPWVEKMPWRRKQQPTPVFLPGKSHGQREPGRLQSMGSQRV